MLDGRGAGGGRRWRFGLRRGWMGCGKWGRLGRGMSTEWGLWQCTIIVEELFCSVKQNKRREFGVTI